VFRLLQFNIQFGQVWDEADPDNAPINLDATIEEILKHDADLILLQEVEHAQPNGVQLDPPPHFTRLQKALPGHEGYFAYPRPDPRELPFGIGLAIFSRTPLRNKMRRELPSPPVEFDFYGKTTTPTDRLMIGARTTIDGRELQVFNTHLLAFFMLKSSSTLHPFQREIVVEQASSTDGPTVLAGDFNVSSHQDLIGQYAERGFKTVQDERITWRRRPYVLDHIFYNAGLRCLSHAVKETTASDHQVLVADFEFA